MKRYSPESSRSNTALTTSRKVAQQFEILIFIWLKNVLVSCVNVPMSLCDSPFESILYTNPNRIFSTPLSTDCTVHLLNLQELSWISLVNITAV